MEDVAGAGRGHRDVNTTTFSAAAVLLHEVIVVIFFGVLHAFLHHLREGEVVVDAKTAAVYVANFTTGSCTFND